MVLSKHLLLIAFFTGAIICASNAQYFSTTIDVDNSSDTGLKIHWTGSEFVILSGTLCIPDEGENRNCPTILRVSPDGELLDYRTIKSIKCRHQIL